MRKNQEEHNQIKILDAFHKEMKSYNMDGGYWIGAIILGVMAGIFMCFPYQYVVEDGLTFTLWISSFNGAACYLQGYLKFMEKGKGFLIDEKLKFHPISKSALYKWRMKNFIRYCTKTTCVFLGLQLFFTLVCIGSFTWGNFLCPLLLGFVIPVAVFSIPYYMKW